MSEFHFIADVIHYVLWYADDTVLIANSTEDLHTDTNRSCNGSMWKIISLDSEQKRLNTPLIESK